MFIKTTYITEDRDGAGKKEVTRLININQIVSMGDAEGDRAREGFKTVLFTPNGYAMFSALAKEEIAALVNSNV